MTELDERSERAPGNQGSTASKSGFRRVLSRRHVTAGFFAAVLAGAMLTTVVSATSASPRRATRHVSTVTLVSPSYKPKAAVGSTDDYHCTLLNPHVTRDSYIITSQFIPGSREDHHAILALVPPSLAPTALKDNADTGNKGWTCFGAPGLPGASLADFLGLHWLSVWAPGHGADDLPKGTGIQLPARSLVIMQVHYNLLVGDKPVQNSLTLDTVPISTPLLPLGGLIALAPPDIPCPTGVTGPLCNRAASLANLAQRFGVGATETVTVLEQICGRNPSNPPVGDTTSCIWPIRKNGYIVRVQAHMHLLGSSFSMVLNPGTPESRMVLNVPHYNFDYQKAYNLKTPIPVHAGDKLQITCTYDPTLAQKLPILRKVPPHFVTWGDGSSDEMCLGGVWTTTSIPNAHDSL
jgi:Copper type II ascorbate-dependent monooxygenase, C-terminal domain